MLAACVASGAPLGALPQANALRILVLEGEDAVNLIDKKTAVKPTVEVRDRNDLPVSGAAVLFMIRSRGATFANGARQFSVMTDSLGRATVNELTPVGRGSIEIEVRASYQGETATTTIRQTNVANASEAARAQGSGGANTAQVGGSLGSGLSGAALAAVAAGSAAAAAVTATAISNHSNTSSSTPFQVTTPDTQGFATVSAAATTTVTPTPSPDPSQCGTARFVWQWQVVFTETAGVAVRLTGGFFTFDGQLDLTNQPGIDTTVPPHGTATRTPFVCTNVPIGSVTTITYTGTDANGHPISVTTNPTTLVSLASATAADAGFAQRLRTAP